MWFGDIVYVLLVNSPVLLKSVKRRLRSWKALLSQTPSRLFLVSSRYLVWMGYSPTLCHEERTSKYPPGKNTVSSWITVREIISNEGYYHLSHSIQLPAVGKRSRRLCSPMTRTGRALCPGLCPQWDTPAPAVSFCWAIESACLGEGATFVMSCFLWKPHPSGHCSIGDSGLGTAVLSPPVHLLDVSVFPALLDTLCLLSRQS